MKSYGQIAQITISARQPNGHFGIISVGYSHSIPVEGKNLFNWFYINVGPASTLLGNNIVINLN